MTEDISLTQDSALPTRSDPGDAGDYGARIADEAPSPSQPTGIKPRVALIGCKGSGKSAIARAVFGAQRAPTAMGAAARYQADAAPVIVDDLPGWVNGAENTLTALFDFLESTPTSDAPLIAIWYTLDASSARVTEYELQLIRRFARRYPVMVVLTRSDLISADALDAMQSAIDEAAISGCVGVMPVAADPLPALGLEPYGIAELVELTIDLSEQESAMSADQPSDQPASGVTANAPVAPVAPNATTPPLAPTAPSPAAPRIAYLTTEQASAQSAPQPTPGQREQAQQPTPVRETPGGFETPDDNYVDDDGVGDGEGGDTTPGAAQSSSALIALLFVLSMAIALLLLGRKRRDDEDED